MTLSELKELIELVSEKEFAEFEMERSGFKLKIVANKVVQPLYMAPSAVPPQEQFVPAAAPAAAAMAATALPASAPRAGEAPAPAPSAPQESDEGIQVVTSPIVGTFYRAPSPTSEPFVKVGDRVDLGDVLCIIEAMKLMNEIESEFAGEIVKIFVENAQPVEYGQPLFGIRP